MPINQVGLFTLTFTRIGKSRRKRDENNSQANWNAYMHLCHVITNPNNAAIAEQQCYFQRTGNSMTEIDTLHGYVNVNRKLKTV